MRDVFYFPIGLGLRRSRYVSQRFDVFILQQVGFAVKYFNRSICTY